MPTPPPTTGCRTSAGPAPSDSPADSQYGHALDAAEPGLLPSSESRDSRPKNKRQRETTRQAMSYPRKRAVTACQLCRARKSKCSNTRPSCELCRSLDTPCRYDDHSDHSSFDPASLEILNFLNRIFERQNDILGHVQTMNVDFEAAHLSLVPPISGVTPGVLAVPSTALQGHRLWGNGNSPFDSLKIPSSRITPDSTLVWPIFENRFPTGFLQEAVFESAGWGDGFGDTDCSFYGNATIKSPPTATVPFQEEAVVKLVERFLSLVHIKNPILDENTLRRYARRAAEDGLSWDGPSCLVLLACALGIIATPFDAARSQAMLDTQLNRDLSSSDPNVLQHADSYFTLARRRMGLLSQSIIASQCFFLSGVYLMYVLRPVEAFQGFHQASILYIMCLEWSRKPPAPKRSRKLEQRLYWSCFKSECELLSELPLPESGIADFDYPHMFPSPPDMEICQNSPAIDDSEDEVVPIPPSRPRLGSTLGREQEQSWFYYLSEISLRRIGNRVINAFYHDLDHDNVWMCMDVAAMISVAEEFMHLLNQWHNGLPPLVRFNEETLHEIPREELPFMLRARMLEIRSWIFRPFLFYAVHHSPADTQQAILLPWVEQALHNSVLLIETSSLRHRHHGVWYTNRVSANSALTILLAAKRNLELPNGWRNAVQLAVETLFYWEAEGPGDMRKARLILEELLDDLLRDGNDDAAIRTH